MRRLALFATAIVLMLGVGATAWAQVDPSPSTTTTSFPETTIPGTTVPETTGPVTTFPPTTDSSPGSTVCAIGTSTTFCFPTSTPPPTTVPPSDCGGRQLTTSQPAKYAERAQETRARDLACFNIRLTTPGQFVVSASGDARLLDWLFQ
jgi:hypothetical protein